MTDKVMKQIENKTLRTLAEYGIITGSIWIMVIGIYFFKFPNNFHGFCHGSKCGDSLVGKSVYDDCQYGALVAGFIFLGRGFGVKTVYASILMSFTLSFLERTCPMVRPLTREPLLELIFAILLPGVGSALLFHIGASSGGTDIVAMILKKYTSCNIGTVLLVVDMAAVIMAFFVFGPETGLFSSLGLMAKSLVIDDVIENINLCKCFSIICDDPGPICDYIINGLNRSATVYEAQGAFTHHRKTVVLTTMKRSQALKLRNYIRRVEPSAFILISNSNEIIGNGFLAG